MHRSSGVIERSSQDKAEEFDWDASSFQPGTQEVTGGHGSFFLQLTGWAWEFWGDLRFFGTQEAFFFTKEMNRG